MSHGLSIHVDHDRNVFLASQERVWCLKVDAENRGIGDTRPRQTLSETSTTRLVACSRNVLDGATRIPLHLLARAGFVSIENLREVIATGLGAAQSATPTSVTDKALLDAVHLYLVQPMTPSRRDTSALGGTEDSSRADGFSVLERRKVFVESIVLFPFDYYRVVQRQIEEHLRIYATREADLKDAQWREMHLQRFFEAEKRRNAIGEGAGVRIWLQDDSICWQTGRLVLPGYWEPPFTEIPLGPLCDLGVMSIPARYYPLMEDEQIERARQLGLSCVVV